MHCFYANPTAGHDEVVELTGDSAGREFRSLLSSGEERSAGLFLDDSGGWDLQAGTGVQRRSEGSPAGAAYHVAAGDPFLTRKVLGSLVEQAGELNPALRTLPLNGSQLVVALIAPLYLTLHMHAAVAVPEIMPRDLGPLRTLTSAAEVTEAVCGSTNKGVIRAVGARLRDGRIGLVTQLSATRALPDPMKERIVTAAAPNGRDCTVALATGFRAGELAVAQLGPERFTSILCEALAAMQGRRLIREIAAAGESAGLTGAKTLAECLARTRAVLGPMPPDGGWAGKLEGLSFGDGAVLQVLFGTGHFGRTSRVLNNCLAIHGPKATEAGATIAQVVDRAGQILGALEVSRAGKLVSMRGPSNQPPAPSWSGRCRTALKSIGVSVP